MRPCIGIPCDANEGGDRCRLTPSGKQCNECPIFKEWERKKKSAFDIKLPLSIEDKQQEVFNLPEPSFDIEKIAADLYRRAHDILTPIELKVYKALFVDHLDEEEAAKLMGYRTSERNRKIGYRRIKQIRRKIMDKIKKITPDYFP